MPYANCKVCSKYFYAKPFHLKKGQGLFCSIKCKSIGTQKRIICKCAVCGKVITKTESKIARSKSGKLFCNKSCQTIWRNKEFSGEKSKLWKGGFSRYRKILLNAGTRQICTLCLEVDNRVLVVHHIDKNRKNISLENLAWLCHNCHYLVHHDNVEAGRFSKLLPIN